MTDYISREKVLDALLHEQYGYLCEDAINRIPAADVRPVVRAKREDDWETGCSTCSACGESYLWEDYDGVGEWNFCPNCGADMREEQT
jgi:hypothetical protein